MPLINLTGQKFGRLVVVKRAKNRGRRTCWLCRCMCGNECIVHADSLHSGNTQSCGCLHSENLRKRNTIHGKANERIYKIWTSMHTRCTNHKHSDYCNYGGRGISVCVQWQKDFMAFYEWAMASGYSNDSTLDRIDNNGNYEPENCRWVARHQQSSNKRNNTDFVGVSFCAQRKKYIAYLKNNGKYILHKRFKSKDDAIKARLIAEKEIGITIERGDQQ